MTESFSGKAAGQQHTGSTQHAPNLPHPKVTVLFKYFGQIFGVGNRQEPSVYLEMQRGLTGRSRLTVDADR